MTKQSEEKTNAQVPAAENTAAAQSADSRNGPAGIAGEIQLLMGDFISMEDVDSILSQAERRRLIGTGVRNYGLIDKAFDIMRDNPQFLPSTLTEEKLHKDMVDFEEIRQLVWVLEKFLQVANEAMLVRGDRLFRDALFIYNNLRELTRARVPGAQPLFEALLKFFRRRRRAGEEESEPTMKELERDFEKLLHGRADGKIAIENEMPHLTAGERKIFDGIHIGHAAVKETIEAEGDS